MIVMITGVGMFLSRLYHFIGRPQYCRHILPKRHEFTAGLRKADLYYITWKLSEKEEHAANYKQSQLNHLATI